MGTRGGLRLKPTKEEGEDDIDLDDVDVNPTGEEDSTNPTSDKEKKENDSLDKRILTLYSRYLFFAFLTKDQVLALAGEDSRQLLADSRHGPIMGHQR